LGEKPLAQFAAWIGSHGHVPQIAAVLDAIHQHLEDCMEDYQIEWAGAGTLLAWWWCVAGMVVACCWHGSDVLLA